MIRLAAVKLQDREVVFRVRFHQPRGTVAWNIQRAAVADHMCIGADVAFARQEIAAAGGGGLAADNILACSLGKRIAAVVLFQNLQAGS